MPGKSIGIFVGGQVGDPSVLFLDEPTSGLDARRQGPSHDFLVGGFKHGFYFPFHIWDVILPIDFHIFQRG